MNACMILAYNEGKFIEKNVTEVVSLFELVIVVNDGSTDNTKEILEELKYNNLKIINNHRNLGAGKSLEIGINEFNNSDCNILIKIDGDGQFKLNDIKRLLSLSKNNYDFVKCDRFWEGGIQGEIPTIRYIGNSIASLFIKISTGNWKINDPLNGLFLFSKKSLKNFSLPKIFHKYGYPFYLNIFMNKNILSNNFKNAQIKNTITYSDEKSKLRPSIMFVKLLWYSIISYSKKILVKFRYSNLQISGIFDVFFLIFILSTTYSGSKLVLINLEYLKGSKASWLFLTILLFSLSSFCFYYSQAYEKKVYEDKFEIL
tara:strand:- start:675 stop:1619 length:945 start_codon:yes stop_codon:yes gene_type:complete